MKVLRVINSLGIGGAERSIATNVPLHNKRGVKTDVLLLNGKDSFFIKQLRQENVKIEVLSKNKNIKFIYNPFNIFKIRKYLKIYDIVHAHLFPSFYWVGLAKMITKTKAKIVLTEHSTENNRRAKGGMIKFIEQKIYSQYDAIIAITPETKSNLKNHLNGKEKIDVIYNGIDLNAFKNVENHFKFPELAINNPYYLVQVAGFRQEKDQKTLIRSLKYLSDNIVAVFVGEGTTQNECIELAKKENLYERCLFLGLQEDIPAIMASADIVVMSSFFEGFGRAAVEGMAAGKPVVASNVKGLANVVNEIQLLFPVGDDKKLAEIVNNLYNNKDLYNSLATLCKKKSEQYSLDIMVAEYENVYKRILNNQAK